MSRHSPKEIERIKRVAAKMTTDELTTHYAERICCHLGHGYKADGHVKRLLESLLNEKRHEIS